MPPNINPTQLYEYLQTLDEVKKILFQYDQLIDIFRDNREKHLEKYWKKEKETILQELWAYAQEITKTYNTANKYNT